MSVSAHQRKILSISNPIYALMLGVALKVAGLLESYSPSCLRGTSTSNSLLARSSDYHASRSSAAEVGFICTRSLSPRFGSNTFLLPEQAKEIIRCAYSRKFQIADISHDVNFCAFQP